MVWAITAIGILLVGPLLCGRIIKGTLIRVSGAVFIAVSIYVFWLATAHSISLAWFSLLVGISHIRLIKGRYGEARLSRIARRSTAYAVISSAIVAVVELLYRSERITLDQLIGVGLVVLLLVTLRALIMSFTRTRPHRATPSPGVVASKTITIAIPARNETHALTDAMRAALSTTYPRVEILVLDDCSQDSTADIIRSFAHDGVRFVQGREPSNNWVGKNNAYQVLLESASGDYIIYCGVDIHLDYSFITNLCSYIDSRPMVMMSIFPYFRRFDFSSQWFYPLRYVWQLAGARLPVSSACWVVDRQWLNSIGGFTVLRHDIFPERSLARRARRQRGYSYVMASDNWLQATTRKRPSSVIETAARTLYPLINKEPVWLMHKIVALLSLLVLPLVAMTMESVHRYMGLGIIVMIALTFVRIQRALHTQAWPFLPLFMPISILSEAILTIYSAYKYEIGVVEWKGRNVCIPVMSQPIRTEEYVGGSRVMREL